jgi:hypothetical protein
MAAAKAPRIAPLPPPTPFGVGSVQAKPAMAGRGAAPPPPPPQFGAASVQRQAQESPVGQKPAILPPAIHWPVAQTKAAFDAPSVMPVAPPETKLGGSLSATKVLANVPVRSASNSSSNLVQCHRNPILVQRQRNSIAQCMEGKSDRIMFVVPQRTPIKQNNVFNSPNNVDRKRKQNDNSANFPRKRRNIDSIIQSGDSLLGTGEKQGYPIGFKSKDEFKQSTHELMAAIRELDKDATMVVAGSSVTGVKFSDANKPFGPESDYDFGIHISNNSVFKRLFSYFPHRNGRQDRTCPVGADQFTTLANGSEKDQSDIFKKIGDCLRGLKISHEHEVNLMFYENLNEAKTGRATIVRPNSPAYGDSGLR